MVLERQRLAAVAQDEDGAYLLLGIRSGPEESAWQVVEARGRIEAHELDEALPDADLRAALADLVRRRLVFADVRSGTVHALSRLAAGPV